MRGNLPSTLPPHGGCPLPTSFSEDGCSICSFSLVCEVTAPLLPLLKDFTALFACQAKKKFLFCNMKRCHFCIPVVFPPDAHHSQSPRECAYSHKVGNEYAWISPQTGHAYTALC